MEVQEELNYSGLKDNDDYVLHWACKSKATGDTVAEQLISIPDSKGTVLVKDVVNEKYELSDLTSTALIKDSKGNTVSAKENVYDGYRNNSALLLLLVILYFLVKDIIKIRKEIELEDTDKEDTGVYDSQDR